MKSPKRIAVLLITGFFAFAPPGTLIFGLMLIIGIVGNVWLVVTGALGLAALCALWLVLRRRRGGRSLYSGKPTPARIERAGTPYENERVG